MNPVLQAVIIIFISGFIGYMTNKVAIKMLFRPIKPINLIFFKIQGVLPKRKDTIASTIATTIQKEFISEDEIIDQLVTKESISSAKDSLKRIIVSKVDSLIPKMAKMVLGDSLNNKIEEYIESEGENIIKEFINEFKNSNKSNFDVAEMVKKKVDKLDILELEKLVKDITSKELKHIEVVGLMLGIFIGVVQSVIFILF